VAKITVKINVKASGFQWPEAVAPSFSLKKIRPNLASTRLGTEMLNSLIF
jgi:hypothetical protein